MKVSGIENLNIKVFSAQKLPQPFHAVPMDAHLTLNLSHVTLKATQRPFWYPKDRLMGDSATIWEPDSCDILLVYHQSEVIFLMHVPPRMAATMIPILACHGSIAYLDPSWQIQDKISDMFYPVGIIQLPFWIYGRKWDNCWRKGVKSAPSKAQLLK